MIHASNYTLSNSVSLHRGRDERNSKNGGRKRAPNQKMAGTGWREGDLKDGDASWRVAAFVARLVPP